MLLRWPISAMVNKKRSTVNKENLVNKTFYSYIKKTCFHINDICSHIKKICLLYRKPTANSHDILSG